MNEILSYIDSTSLYRLALIYYGLYPMLMALAWVLMSTIYFFRREWKEHGAGPDQGTFVSIVVPAYAEEDTIEHTLQRLVDLDYGEYEVVVVTDGSPDRTPEIVRDFPNPRVRLLEKRVNEGKAMALNDALPLCRGEVIVFVDGDIMVRRNLLRTIVPHFSSPRVGAVTGNPRVRNRLTLLGALQAIEFTSIISVQRRAQRIWGRVLTVSGAVMAVRKSALADAGLFSPDMATEDIDLTWKLQRKFWDVRYEPAAVVWMEAPPTLRELWKQRRRWATGLAQVLRKHRGILLDWKTRRLWPVYIEASASVLWGFTFVLMTAYWIICLLLSYAPYGASPIPNLWGMLLGTACLVQLFSGVLMDRRYDRSLPLYYPAAIFYPLVYWMLMSMITTIYTFSGLFGRAPKMHTWRIERMKR